MRVAEKRREKENGQREKIKTPLSSNLVNLFMMYWQPEIANQMAPLQPDRPGDRGESNQGPDANWKCP